MSYMSIAMVAFEPLDILCRKQKLCRLAVPQPIFLSRSLKYSKKIDV